MKPRMLFVANQLGVNVVTHVKGLITLLGPLSREEFDEIKRSMMRAEVEAETMCPAVWGEKPDTEHHMNINIQNLLQNLNVEKNGE